MTHYQKVTREEIARRNYTEGTTRAYLRVLDDLARYFQCPPERLHPEQIREYTAHLFRDRKLSDNTVNQMVGALRFFYLKVLNKPWRGHEMPYPKKSMRLPVIWRVPAPRRGIVDAPRSDVGCGPPLPANVNEMVKPGPDGKYHVVGHPNWGIQEPASPHFGGKVIVLMNGGSFSTTCEFLSMLHNRGGATFAGEEAAGGYYGDTSGAAAVVALPNSRLSLPVQLVGYYLAIDGTAQGAHGIRPDYPVVYSIDDILAGRDRAMELALHQAGETAPIRELNREAMLPTDRIPLQGAVER